MDFNELFENEVNKRVKERLAQYKAQNNCDVCYENLRKEMTDYFTKNIGHMIGLFITELQSRNVKELDACDCDGTCDECGCTACNDDVETEELKDDAVEKACETLKEFSAEQEKKQTDEDIKKKKEEKELKNNLDKIFDSFGDFFEDFGITKDTFKNAKIEVLSNKDAFKRLSSIIDDFRLF